MSLQVELKKSAVSQKLPFPSDLALGEIALNYNADGPFLTCKDTAGNIRKLNRVWVAATAPSSPTTGDPWLDTSGSTALLRIYDGSAWTVAATIPLATTSAYGTVQLATSADIANGTAGKIVDAAQLQSKITTELSATPITFQQVQVVGNTTIGGNLTVNGTTTTIDTVNLVVKDKNIEMGVVDTPTDTTADGGGITLKGTTDKTINWVDATDAWTSSERFSVPLGSAASPSLTFTGDENTGIYSPGADQVAISTNGTGRLFVDANGQVGISATPNTARDLAIFRASFPTIQLINTDTGTTATDGFLIQQGSFDTYFVNKETGNMRFLTSDTERLRITSDGKLGLGTSAPGVQLEVANTGIIRGSASGDSTYPQYQLRRTGSTTFTDRNWTAFISSNGSLQIKDETAPADRLTITTAGNVGVGTTSPGAQLDVAATNPTLRLTSTFNGNPTVGNSLAALDFYSSDTTGAGPGVNCFVRAVYEDTFGADVGLAFGTTSSNGTGTERLRIDHAGTATFTSAASTAPFVAKISTSEVARIDSSGRLLVGTSSARANFLNSTVGAILQTEGSGFSNSSVSVVRSSNDAFASAVILGKNRGSVGANTVVQSGDEIGRISLQGNDGTAFVEAASIQAFVDGTPSANDIPGRLVFSTTADGASSPTERMRITQDGAFLLNTGGDFITPTSGTTDGFQFNTDNRLTISADNNGPLYLRRRSSNGALAVFYRDTTQVGSITVTTTATAYNTSSDYRLKENITAVTDGITRLQQLKPSRFNFIADPTKTVDGFLAHEVQAIVPEAITGEKDAVDDEGNPQYQGIDQSKLVPLLTAALQEAIGEIESLKARVAALETP